LLPWRERGVCSFFQAEDGIRDRNVTGVQTCALPIYRVQLTETDILEKEFKKSMRGYNEEDVDEFLDIIIKDYDAFTQEINRLRQENERFRKSTEQPRTQHTSRQAAPTQVNYDVLKR